jgi:threonine/homoserine/homoserine lactone efflux protein
LDYSGILLLGMGFVVGLSGALIPGPLLVYTINESLQKGRWTGLSVILGHALVEVGIFLLLVLGLLEFMSMPWFVKAASLLGGLALILMGMMSLRSVKEGIPAQAAKVSHGVIWGGIIFTIFNPSFPVWWATAGTRLLMEGYQEMGLLGMILVLVGHWGADFGWFTLVSLTTSKSSGTLLEKGWYRTVRIILSLLLLGIGAYFLSTGI